MASTARVSSGPWIDFLSVLVFPTFQSLGICAGNRACGDCCLDNCLLYHADCPKGLQGSAWQQQDSCVRASILLSRCRPKCKRYFSPIDLLIKHLNTLVGLVTGVKEGCMRWSGRRQGTSSDGAGVWSQGNIFRRARSSPLLVAKSLQGLGYSSAGRENHSTLCSTYRAPFHDHLKHANE